MVVCGSYMYEISVSKDMKKMPSTLANERFANMIVGRHS